MVKAEREDVTVSEQIKEKPTKKCGHFKLKMVRKMDAGTLVGTAVEHISVRAELTSEGLPPCNARGTVVSRAHCAQESTNGSGQAAAMGAHSAF